MKFRYWSLFFLLGTFFIGTPALAATSTTTPPTCAISVSPRYIYQGKPTVLSWQSQFARGGYIDQIGPMTAASGSMTIAPSVSTTFKATVWNNVGTTTCGAYVVVYTSGNGNVSICPPGATYSVSPSGGVSCGMPNGTSVNLSQLPQCALGQYLSPIGSSYICKDACVPGQIPRPNDNQQTGWSCDTPSCTTPGEVAVPDDNAEDGYSCVPASQVGAQPTQGTAPAASTQAGPNQPTATGLIPCGGGDATNWRKATECSFCDLGALAQNVINFFLALIVPIAIALFAYAGILYFTSGSNPGNIDKAKQIFRTAFVGFLIAISAWLLIGTAINILVAGSKGWESFAWNRLECDRNRPLDVNVSTWLGGLFGSAGTPPAQVSQTPGGTGGQTLSVASIQSKYGTTIQAACNTWTVPPQNCGALVAALIAKESSGNPGAVSDRGAVGIMQILPANGGKTCDASDSSCITSQIQLGASLLNQYYQSTNNNVALTLAEYNGGAAAIKQSACCPTGYAYQCDWDCGTTVSHAVNCLATPQPSQCVPNKGFVETRNYVQTILNTCSTVSATGC